MSRPDHDKLRAWRSFLTAHSEVLDHLSSEMTAEGGLSLTWYEVLLYLHDAPDHRLRMHQLADSLLLSRSAVTRFIDRIEEAGLVARTRCDDDRRGTFVALTPQGLDTFKRTGPIHLRGIERHFARLITQEEAEVMRRAFDRVAAAARGDR